MTEVLEPGVALGLDSAGVGRRRRDADEPRLVDDALADRLLAQAAEQGVELLGEGGLLKQMTKAILERSLQVELSDHLGYEQGDPAGAGSGNSRNGTTPKRLAAEAGQVDLDVPRDRQGTFEPQTAARASGAWTASTSSSWASTPVA
jgi:putative transposase